MNTFLISVHLISATIWTGGHLILAIAVLPKILKYKDIKALTTFEENFERIGIPSLLIQVISGLILAYNYLPDFSAWFSFADHISTHIGIKLILLATTIVLALHARFKLIPNLSEKNLNFLALHIILVTLVGVLFVVTGLSFRLHLF